MIMDTTTRGNKMMCRVSVGTKSTCKIQDLKFKVKVKFRWYCNGFWIKRVDILWPARTRGAAEVVVSLYTTLFLRPQQNRQ
jgi:hypothetical protein